MQDKRKKKFLLFFTNIINFIIMVVKEVTKMIKKELESNKRYIATMVTSYKYNKDLLEKTEEVKCYLEILEYLKREQECQKFLNDLEIGEDGTVFSFYDEYQDRAQKSTHFGLAKSLNFALDLIRQNKEEEIIELGDKFYILSFEQFQSYLDNAREILTDMNYVHGDRLFDNEYQYVIHENPKNYSVVDFRQLVSLTKSDLEQNYNIFHVWITLDLCFAIKKEKFDSLNVWENLTPREYEAFYGEKAKQILGLVSKKEKSKGRKLNT